MARLESAVDTASFTSPAYGGPVDAEGEVICPLLKPDGRPCGKRCLGERRFRSIQEHIRRAHPDDYLPRLSATKESFEKMVTAAATHTPKRIITISSPKLKKSNIILSSLPCPERPHLYKRAKSGEHLSDEYSSTTSSALSELADLSSMRLKTPSIEELSTTKKPRKRKYQSTDLTYRVNTDLPYHPHTIITQPSPVTSTYDSNLSCINDDDPDSTLEELEGQHIPTSNGVGSVDSDESSRRWDELVFAATNATGVELQDPNNPTTKTSSATSNSTSSESKRAVPIPIDRRTTPPDSSTSDKVVSRHEDSEYSLPPCKHLMLNVGKYSTSFSSPQLAPLPLPLTQHQHQQQQQQTQPHQPPSRTHTAFENQITISYTPRVECSHCSRLSEMHETYACPECISGLCRDCVVSAMKHEARDRTHKCPVCDRSVMGFKAVRMRIR